MVSVSSVLMAPVRGVVWLIKLPFVLVWMLLRYIGSCIYRAVAAILSVPAYYLGRVRDRLRLTWAWAKGSATRFKLCLPFTSNYSTHGSLKALPAPRNEYNTYHVYNTEGMGPYGSSSARRRRRSDRKSRKAIAEALTKLLLEPCSPSDSDEDSEAMRSSQSEEVDERSVKLIMDLLKLSKSDGDSQVRPTLTPQDLQALRERTRNKQQLESLIAEVDQMARDVDPSVILSKGQGQGSQLCPPSSTESDQHQPKRRHKTHKSSSSQAKKTSKSSRDTYKFDHDQHEEGVGEGLEEEESRGTVVPQHRHKYMGDLSPVQESPEYKSEEMNYQELEKDLNLALSKLDSAISQLPSDLTEETQITHTVMTITSTQQQQQQQQQRPAEEEDDSLFQDSHEEFPSVPKVQPSLGLKAGHARRDIAAARKPRPPSRKVTAAEQQGNAREQIGKRDDPPLFDVEDSWDDEEDSELGDPDESSGSEGEGEGEIPGHYKHRQRPKKLCGGIELSDQLRLLSPTPKSSLQSEIGEVNSSSGLADSADVASLYASVNKKKKSGSQNRPRTSSDPTPTATSQSGLPSRGSSHSMTSDLGDRGELEDSWKEKSSPRITSNQPPWIEMRTRKKSGDSDSLPSSTPLLASSQPPWIEMRSHKNSSGYSSSASTPTTTNAPPPSLHSTPHPTHTPSSPSTTHTPPQHVHDLSSSHRVLPPKPAIPRPEPPPPPSSSTSEMLLQTYSTEDEEEEEISAVKREDSTENFYDSLQPKDEVPQRESRIFPLHEYRQDRPKYLHEAISDSQKREETASISSVSSRGRRGSSLRLRDPSPTLSQKNSASRLKRTSSADTVTKVGKPKQRHSSSSSTRRLEERRSSDSHRQRNRSSSGERTPLSQRSSDKQKRGSTSSSTKSSPSPRGESSAGALSTMWKLLATPTTSRKHQSSSGGKDSKKRNDERDKHSSSSDSLSRDESPPLTKSKVKQSPSKADKKI